MLLGLIQFSYRFDAGLMHIPCSRALRMPSNAFSNPCLTVGCLYSTLTTAHKLQSGYTWLMFAAMPLPGRCQEAMCKRQTRLNSRTCHVVRWTYEGVHGLQRHCQDADRSYTQSLTKLAKDTNPFTSSLLAGQADTMFVSCCGPLSSCGDTKCNEHASMHDISPSSYGISMT